MTDPTSPDEPGLFDLVDSGTAPSTRVVPEGQHPWSPSVLAALDAGEETQSAYHQMIADRTQALSVEQEFEEKVREGERRYNMDPEFHLKAKLLTRIVFANRSRAILDAIRAIVALEEMDGGVLDKRLKQ